MKIVAFILCTLLPLQIFSQNKIEKYLDSLDTEVIRSSSYALKKQNEISQLKKNLETASFLQDKYSFCKRIFIEYSKYQSDSAQYYLNKWYEYGQQSKNPKWEQEILLYKAYIQTLRSDFTNANHVLSQLPDIENIEPELRYLYARIQFERLLHINILAENKDSSLNIRIWNKYSPYISPTDVYYSIYYTILFPHKMTDSIYTILKTEAERVPNATPQKAFLQFCLAHLSELKGDMEQSFIYVICSAITDIQMVNKDSQSMLYIIQLMSQYMEGKDQLGRLYKYTQFCSDNICDYKDLGRSLQLIVIQNQVQKMYKQFISQKQQRYSATLIICLILIIVAAGIAYASVRRYKKKIKDITDVTQDYQKQQALISELQRESKTANDKINALEAEIERKNNFYIESLRTQVSLVTKFSQTKKTLLNLITTSQLREAKKLLSDSLLNNSELNQLYESFDEIFLSIHPDFVERFNKLLTPEAQITLESPQKLTIELRIYALVCLGVTDSISIAKLLNYSPQTIYNYRLKIRHSSIIPEKDFAKTVMNMYKDDLTDEEAQPDE